MAEKIIKYKKYILGIAPVIMLLTLFFGINNLMKNKNNEPLPEVKLREINKSKAFAVMVQNGDTYKEYTSTDNKWPGSDYIFKEAKCVNGNGELVEDVITFNNETRKATLTTKQTVYCTLYFDHKETIEILRETDVNENISPEPNQGGMYRYQGTDNVANWICFGTADNLLMSI